MKLARALTVSCVNTLGRAVPNTTVYVQDEIWIEDDSKVADRVIFDSTESSTRGIARIKNAESKNLNAVAWQRSVYAVHPSGLVSIAFENETTDRASDSALDLAMLEGESVRGTVAVPAQFSPSDTTVAIREIRTLHDRTRGLRLTGSAFSTIPGYIVEKAIRQYGLRLHVAVDRHLPQSKSAHRDATGLLYRAGGCSLFRIGNDGVVTRSVRVPPTKESTGRVQLFLTTND